MCSTTSITALCVNRAMFDVFNLTILFIVNRLDWSQEKQAQALRNQEVQYIASPNNIVLPLIVFT